MANIPEDDCKENEPSLGSSNSSVNNYGKKPSLLQEENYLRTINARIGEYSEDSFFEFGSASFREKRRKLERMEIGHCTPVRSISLKRKRNFKTVVPRVNFCDMPPEVIEHIIYFLNKRDLLTVGQTCKKLYALSCSPIHWRAINVVDKKILESAFHRLINRNTRTVAAMHAIIYVDPQLTSRAFLPCNLTRLDLSWCRLHHPDMLYAILQRCRKLLYLGLETLPVNAKILDEVAENRSLICLNLGGCTVIPAESIQKIFKNCVKLADLNLSWCEFDADASQIVVSEMPRTVKRLSLAGTCDNAVFNDENLINLTQRLPDLTEIDVGDNTVITQAFVAELARIKNLHRVNLSRCYAIEPIALTWLTQVRVLNCFGSLSADGLQFLQLNMPQTDINQSIFTTVARSVSVNPNVFWGADISEPY